MALSCSAEIEVHSLNGCLELLGKGKCFFIEICVLNDTFCTGSLSASSFMIFDERFVFKKEFPKNFSLQDIVDLLKASSVQLNLVEVKSQECKNSLVTLASAKVLLSSFLFPSSTANKYRSVKLFPHKRFQPAIKFWVDAVIYRANPPKSQDIPVLEMNDLNQTNYEDKPEAKKGVNMAKREGCKLCDIFIKHTGRPYCGHDHLSSKESLDKEIEDECCKDKGKQKGSARRLARRKVQFWLNQLRMLSCKPVDEFTNLLRNIYTKEYSKALNHYNSIASRNSV